MTGDRYTNVCFNIKMIGICVYGSAGLLYCELKPDAQGVELYQVVTEKWGVSMNLQILTHRGKLVNPALSLVHQGFVHGSTVFATIKAKGGGENGLPSESGNSSSSNSGVLIGHDSPCCVRNFGSLLLHTRCNHR